MAADNYSNLSPALATTFAAQIVRAWNRTSELLARIPFMSGGGQGGGKQVGWDVQFSGATAASFAEGSDVDLTDEVSHDVEKPATLPWGWYRSAFSLTNLELNVAAQNTANAVELERILEERFFGAVTAITSKMNQDAIAGTGTDGSGHPTIIGLLVAADDSTSYGGLSKGTYPEWKGNVQANGGTPRPLTLDLLAKADQAQYTASATSPEILVTTPGVKTRYEGMFNSVQRVMAPNGSGSPIQRMDASSEDLYWRGRPIVRDKDMTTGTLLGVRASALEMRILPWAPIPDGVPTNLRDLLSSNGDLQRALGAFVNVYPLARTGSSVKFCAEIYAQLKVRRTNEHFILRDIAET